MTAGIGAGGVCGAQGRTQKATRRIFTEFEDRLKSSRLQDGTFVLVTPRKVQAT